MVTEVIRASRRWGRDPLLVQGAGGNVSWKDGDTLWIKASGTSLAHAAPETFLPMSLSSLRSDNPDERARPPLVASKHRPSIETRMHGVIPHRVVVHLHAVDVLAHLVRVDWRDALASALHAPTLRAAPVPYARPGEPLAQAVAAATAADGGQPDVYLLQSHGIVVGGDDVGQVEDRLAALLAAIPQAAPAAARRSCVVEGSRFPAAGTPVVIDDPGLVQHAERAWALYPDHVVFLGPAPVLVDDPTEVNAPSAFPLAFIRGVGAVIGPTLTAAQWAQFECYRAVVERVPSDTELEVLDDHEIEGLLGWDAEEHRQKLAR